MPKKLARSSLVHTPVHYSLRKRLYGLKISAGNVISVEERSAEPLPDDLFAVLSLAFFSRAEERHMRDTVNRNLVRIVCYFGIPFSVPRQEYHAKDRFQKHLEQGQRASVSIVVTSLTFILFYDEALGPSVYKKASMGRHTRPVRKAGCSIRKVYTRYELLHTVRTAHIGRAPSQAPVPFS